MIELDFDGQTVQEQGDENTGLSEHVIIESPDEEKQPRIEVHDSEGKILRRYLLPSGAHLMVEDGQEISAVQPLEEPQVRGTRPTTIGPALPAGASWMCALVVGSDVGDGQLKADQALAVVERQDDLAAAVGIAGAGHLFCATQRGVERTSSHARRCAGTNTAAAAAGDVSDDL